MTASTLADADLLFAEGMILTCTHDLRKARWKFRRCELIRRRLLGRQRPTALAIQMHADTITGWFYDKRRRDVRQALLTEARSILEEQEGTTEAALAIVLDQLSELDGSSFDDPGSNASKLRKLALSIVMPPHNPPEKALHRNYEIIQSMRLSNALWLIGQVHGEGSLELARSLVLAAEKHYSSFAKPKDAMRMVDRYDRALPILVKHLGPDHSEVANAHDGLGFAHSVLAERYQASKHYEQALRIVVLNHGIASHEALQARKKLLGVGTSHGRAHLI